MVSIDVSIRSCEGCYCSLVSVVGGLRSALSKMESRVSVLEKRTTTPAVNGNAAVHKSTPDPQKSTTAPVKEDDEDDIDLFGSDEEVDEEAERLKEQRLQEYAAKKAKKPALIAKSSILLDVKPVRTCTEVTFPLLIEARLIFVRVVSL